MKAKGIFTHLSKLSANKKGLTLIEVIVSIGILAIVTGPFWVQLFFQHEIMLIPSRFLRLRNYRKQ